MQAKKIKFDSKARKLLHKWLERESMSVYRFTKIIDGHYQNVRLWMIGQTRPGYTNAIKIEELTDGFVPVKSWDDLNESSHHPKDANHQSNTAKDHQHALKNKRLCKPGKKCA
jgi:hypothetical protein